MALPPSSRYPTLHWVSHLSGSLTQLQSFPPLCFSLNCTSPSIRLLSLSCFSHHCCHCLSRPSSHPILPKPLLSLVCMVPRCRHCCYYLLLSPVMPLSLVVLAVPELLPIIAATVTSTAVKASSVATTITVTCCWGDCCSPPCSCCCCQHCCLPSPIAAKALLLSSLFAHAVFCCQYHCRYTATCLHLLKPSGDLERLVRIHFIFAMFNLLLN